MKKLNLLIVAWAFFTVAQEPVFSFIEYDPWAMVMGADSPLLTLYDDGRVIYQTKNGFSRTKIDSINLERLSVTPEKLSELKDSYSASYWTDQPSFVFWWKNKKIHIYGRFCNVLEELTPPVKPEGRVSKRKLREYEHELREYNMMQLEKTAIEAVPSELKRLYSTIQKIREIESTPWLPEFIEVLLWPYEYAPNEIEWPKEFPDLDDANTKVRRTDSYSVYVPSSSKTELYEFIKDIPQKTAVLINGKKMAISCRYPFPSEEKWMK